MKIADAFPSKYLKPDELRGAAPVVVIASVRFEAVGQRKTTKPVVYFVGKSKGLILNKTNATAIATILGKPDTDDWGGGRIRLFATTTTFGGDTVACIRVRAPGAAVTTFPADARRKA